MLIALGLIFEIPLAILAVTRLGIVTPDQLGEEPPLRDLVIAIVAALLPSIDPVTLMLEIVPIVDAVRVEYLARSGLGAPRKAPIPRRRAPPQEP